MVKQYLVRYWGVIVLVALSAILRLYRVQYPLADWHSWRQADTASVTREYVKHGINVLVPRFHDLSNIPAGLDNPEGYRMVEFPFVNAALALLLRAFPQLDLVTTSRVASVIVSAATAGLLFLLISRQFGQTMGWLVGLSFALNPYHIFYGRVILPEPYMVFFLIAFWWSWYQWLNKHQLFWWLTSTISLMLGLLLKPFVAFALPVVVAQTIVTLWQQASISKKQQILTKILWRSEWLVLLISWIIAFIPLVWWRHWIEQYPSGVPANDWLFNGNGIRWRPAWFRWLGYERGVKLFLGYVGVLPFLVAIFMSSKTILNFFASWFKRQKLPTYHEPTAIAALILSWWTAVGVYSSVIATGNVQHDYYQNFFIPAVSLTLGFGYFTLIQLIYKHAPKGLGRIGLFGIVAGIALGQWVGSWQLIKGNFNVNHWEYVHAGQAVDALIPADARVIAPAMGDTQFLFQTNRTGWPIGFGIEAKQALGATHYVSTSQDDETTKLMKQYSIVKQTPEFVILDLKKPL